MGRVFRETHHCRGLVDLVGSRETLDPPNTENNFADNSLKVIMATSRYSRWDGSQEFSPQSADKLFDELSQYLTEYGDEVLESLENWEETHPEILEMLIKRGHIEKDESGKYRVTPKGLRRVENKALEELFDVRKRDQFGKHETEMRGAGQTVLDETKAYEFGDPVSLLNLHETLRNAMQRSSERSGAGMIHIKEEDLVIHETEYQTSCATVVLLDMSGSMSRYGKYGAAKKVALAMQSLVRGKYQGDFI
ncbi:MAG: hypothetical protein FJ267_19290, partial [Planctomycetes bacterium]|nr:hypothetical protein [Planctomycetota bacterium]